MLGGGQIGFRVNGFSLGFFDFHTNRRSTHRIGQTLGVISRSSQNALRSTQNAPRSSANHHAPQSATRPRRSATRGPLSALGRSVPPKKMDERPAMGGQGSPKRGCRRGRGGQLLGGEILLLLVCPGLFQISSLSNGHRSRVVEASGPSASRAGVRRATRSTPAVVRTTSTPVPVVHALYL